MPLADAFRRLRSWLLPRRAYARARVAVAVDWRIFGDVVHRVSTTADLSRGGAFLHTADPKPVDTPLVLEIATKRSRTDVHARVAWTSAQGMGVRFMRELPGALT